MTALQVVQLRAAAAALLSLTACGCATEDAPGAGNDAGGHESSRYLGGASCQACLAELCYREEYACEREPECRKVLDCRRRCADPACHAECLGSYLEAFIDFPTARFETCAAGYCREKCRSGRQFDCEGRYSWAPLKANETVVRLRVADVLTEHPIFGIRVTACREQAPPCEVVAAENSDEQGRVVLTVPVEPASSRFEGVLELTDATGFYQQTLARASFRDIVGQVLLWQVAEFRRRLELIGRPWDASKGFVGGLVRDCHLGSGSGLTGGVEPPQQGAFGFAFPRFGGAPLPESNEFGGVGVMFVAPGDTEFVAIDVATRFVRARERLFIRADFSHAGEMVPLTREQLQSVPP
jgi:hypothetical protein